MGSTDLQGAAWDAGLPWWTITAALDAACERGRRAGVREGRLEAHAALGKAVHAARRTGLLAGLKLAADLARTRLPRSCRSAPGEIADAIDIEAGRLAG